MRHSRFAVNFVAAKPRLCAIQGEALHASVRCGAPERFCDARSNRVHHSAKTQIIAFFSEENLLQTGLFSGRFCGRKTAAAIACTARYYFFDGRQALLRVYTTGACCGRFTHRPRCECRTHSTDPDQRLLPRRAASGRSRTGNNDAHRARLSG